MFLVGLTGGIGTGKSTVSKHLQELGVEVIDGDKIAREVVEPGKRAWKRLVKEFGDRILLSDGVINRQLLGEIIFSNDECRKKINAITHPEIYKSIFWKCFRHLLIGRQFVVLDLPLLYESGKVTNYLNKVIVVTCNDDQQLTRVMKRNDLSEEEAMKRIKAQMPLAEKRDKADYVIDNSDTFQHTKEQIKIIVTQLRNSRAHWKTRFLLGFTFTLLINLIGVATYWSVKLII